MHAGWQNGENFTIGIISVLLSTFGPDGPLFMKGVLNSIRISVLSCRGILVRLFTSSSNIPPAKHDETLMKSSKIKIPLE